MPPFDAFLFVDWSARGVPGPVRESKDSLWAASNLPLFPNGTETVRYFRTRAECIALIREALVWWVEEGYRVLVGFDFPYGYPRGFADLLQLPGLEHPGGIPGITCERKFRMATTTGTIGGKLRQR